MWEFDTLSIGSATLDIFLKSDQFGVKPAKDHKTGEDISLLTLRYGSKMDVQEFSLQSGGGATNSAVGFARMGFRAGVLAEIGTDSAARTVLSELQAEGVSTELIIQEPSEQTAVSALLIAGDGGRSVATGRGASQMLTLSDVDFNRIHTNWVHLSSVGNVELVKAIGQWCKKRQVPLSWNPGGAELTALESGELHLQDLPTTIFCVNTEESTRLKNAGYALEGAGQTVIITDGRNGGSYWQFGKWQSYAPTDVAAVQETGAGDSFITGVAAARLYDAPIEKAIRWGVENASSVVQHMGAKTGLLRQEDYQKWLEK